MSGAAGVEAGATPGGGGGGGAPPGTLSTGTGGGGGGGAPPVDRAPVTCLNASFASIPSLSFHVKPLG